MASSTLPAREGSTHKRVATTARATMTPKMIKVFFLMKTSLKM
jgi:hypothetical protein